MKEHLGKLQPDALQSILDERSGLLDSEGVSELIVFPEVRLFIYFLQTPGVAILVNHSCNQRNKTCRMLWPFRSGIRSCCLQLI